MVYLKRAKKLLASKKFDESLSTLNSLRKQQADYPNIDAFEKQIRNKKRLYDLQVHLDDIYEEAQRKLSTKAYWDALSLWSQIESEEEIQFKDIVDVAGRAKICLIH